MFDELASRLPRIVNRCIYFCREGSRGKMGEGGGQASREYLVRLRQPKAALRFRLHPLLTDQAV
jgi:hypothetical protein